MVETPAQLDEQALARQMSLGDQDALRAAVTVFGGKVRGWLRKTFGHVLQTAELDEAFNVATYNVWRFADRFDASKGSLGGWYLKIAQRAAESILRRDASHRQKSLEYDPSFDPTIDYSKRSGDDRPYFAPECIRDLGQVINKRLVGLQQAIILADIAAGGQADNERLAEIHRTTVNSIKVSRSKARKNVLKAMVELGYDETGRRKNHD